MNVKRHAYRFRFLNSSNQRFYQIQLSNGMPFTIIGEDGGYLRTRADGHRVQHRRHGARRHHHRLLEHPGRDEDRPAERRAAAAADRRGRRIPTPTARSCSSRSSAGPTVPPQALPATLNTHRHADARPADALPDPERPVRRPGPPAAGGARRPAVPHADHGAARRSARRRTGRSSTPRRSPTTSTST